ncbi:hypothetical protein BU26DRAFT_604114 [Trematosphaeria pertusa]|uniref:Uncharacterized protein n=1 Tax=Trematosphaeria pertusa TaxID=390896 RepID=A0A6A6IH97_9PLEO|nr:uncharacterized protein BU26DRAFT_604114 [Trematosphaeria pertusa]KAF2249801.1 hypothetical protein BU26DRAFT_604114 [Trematosphaeria pertusa]
MIMANFSVIRVTALTYSILVNSVILLFLSVAEIVLEDRVLHAFRSVQIQYPGSSLAEWLFVSMNPRNIDSGPTTAIFLVGGGGLICALVGIGCILATWWGVMESKTKKFGLAICLAAMINTAADMAVLVYVFVTEAKNATPRFYVQWQKTTFTREYWVCKAFPSVFEDADILYGFPACNVAQAARYMLVAICCVSAVLVGLSVFQVQKAGALGRVTAKPEDIEKGTPPKSGFLKSNGLPNHYRHKVEMVPAFGSVSANNLGNVRVQRPPSCVKNDGTAFQIQGYYSRL